ncbi:MAG: substrate-binding domain-containing protein [Planctomycetaceae bacterium]|nr:substrate-binding domain-containing protein [Planctomycetaceae bacterium]
MQRSLSATIVKGIVALFLLCAITFFGCGKQKTPTLYIYCNETFWYVLQEEAIVFNRVYGYRVFLIPLRAPRTSDEKEEALEINGDPLSPAPWESRPDLRTTPQAIALHSQIHPEIENLIKNIAEDSFGDLLLSDSQRHVEKLQETALTAAEFPVCYLTLTMLVPKDNPHQLRSIKDVLDSNRRLGIVDPSLDGLGESSWTVLGRIVLGGESAIPMELVQLYERQYDLLEALEQGRIDAALVWNAASQMTFLLVKYADEYNADPEFEPYLREAERQRSWEKLQATLQEMRRILFEEKSFAEEVPLTENPDERQVVAVRLVVLSSTTNFGYSKRFTDFMRSNQGKEIFRRFGFVAE